MRRNFISVTWTPGVDSEDAQILIHIIEDTYGLLRRHFGPPGQFDPLPSVRIFGAWAISTVPADAAYANIDWYVTRSLDNAQQRILASRYLNTVILEPWQSTDPHFDLAMTDLPLVDDLADTDSDTEVMGICRPGLLSLISSNLLGRFTSPELRKLAMQHILAHYLGRLFDIPLATREESVMSRQSELYCTDNCAMRFTDDPARALDFGRQQASSGVIYCDACQRDLIAQITGFHYGLN